MRKTLALGLLLIVMLGCGGTLAVAQDESPTSDQTKPAKPAIEESKSKPDQHERPLQPYRLDFTLSELEAGKKINTRHCSMNLTAGSANEIKIGTRVPVSTGAGSQFQYMDVGTNIWANLREVGNDLQLEVRSDLSSLDMSPARDHSNSSAPIVRQIQINGKTLLVTGKAITVGTIDDPNSNHEFQLEVTATRLR
ncbi:MAG TPA: hypothetical protein VIG91_02530 [Terriglobales bacterium]